MLQFLSLNGHEARKYLHDLAQLRLTVFWDFPYLYEGTLDYEVKYLETYLKAEHSFILLVYDQHKIVGATTGIWAQEEEESFRSPFEKVGIDPRDVFYFGESILLPEYRGRGIGKKFFEEREAFARTLPFVKMLSFCSVIRDESHPLRPEDYRPLDDFWASQGFSKSPDLRTNYSWKDRDETKESQKTMQFWVKHIRS